MSERVTRLRIEAVSDLPDIATQLSELIRLEGKLLESMNQANLSARTGSIQQIEAINAVSAALEKQRTSRKKADDEAVEGTKAIQAQINNITSGLKTFTGMVASAFAVAEIKNFGESIIEAKTRIDSVQISLETMLGSKKEADALYARVVELSQKTPFSLQEVSEQVGKLKAYNIETADLIPTITALGNIAAAVGKEKLPQLTLAYGQVANTGKLMLSELRQFSEAGVPLLSLIEKSYGKTSAEVQKMAEDHQISFAMVRKAILDASEAGGKYAGLMEKLSKTVGGEISNLADTFEVAKARIGDFFEDQISGGTARLKGLIDTLAGSNSAIQRTVTFIESAAVAFTTWKVAMNAAGAQQLILNGYTKASEAVMGTYNLVMILVKGSTEGFTRAQQESAVASRTMWATLASNPIGAVVALVGLATSAYLAWEAATAEVTTSIGEQELNLKTEISSINSLVEVAKNAAIGTQERKDAIATLIAKYPEYFSGLNAEKTSNSQLQGILDKVNGSYMTRISLARQAYKLEGIQEEMKKNLKEEEEILRAFPEDLRTKYGGDINKAIQDVFANPAVFDRIKTDWLGQADFNLTRAKEVGENLKRLAAEDAKIQLDAQKSGQVAKAAELEQIKKHYATLREQADGNAKEIAKINADEKVALAKANGTYREKELADTITHAEKTKTVTLLSAKEIAVIKKEAGDSEKLDRLADLKDQLDYLNKKEAEEIEAVNKRIVNRKISDAQLAKLKEQARVQIETIDTKYDAERKKIEAEIEVEKQARFVKSTQETTDKIVVLTKQRLEAERILILLNDAKTNEQRVAALREYNDKFELNLKDQAARELKIQLDASKKALDDIVAKNGERGEEYRKAYAQWLKDNQQYNSAVLTQTVTAAKETAQQIKEYEKEIQEANRETAQLDKDTLQVQIRSRKEIIGLTLDLLGQQSGMVGQASQAIRSVMNNIDGLSAKSLQAAQDGVANANIYLSNIKLAYEEGTAIGDAAIARANQGVADANNVAAKAQAATDAAFLGLVSTGIQVVLALAGAIRERMAEACKVAAESMGRLRDVFKDIYEQMAQTSRESYELQMEAAKGNTEKQLAIINDFYKTQDELASSSARIDAEVAYHQKFFELRGEQKKMLLWWEQDEQDALYREQARAAQKVLLFQANIDALERQKLKAKEVHETQLADIDAYNQRFKEAVDERIDKLNEELEKAKAIREQESSDKQLRLENDDTFRAEILAKAEAREIQNLEEAKQRELQRAQESQATAEELARIEAAFEKSKADTHAKFEDAKKDKSEQVKLATIEIKTQEKDSVNAMESDSAKKVLALQNQVAQNEAEAAIKKKIANAEYTNAVIAMNQQIFEANKQMKVAEIQSEIAILNAQKSWTGIGNGKINEAIGQLQQAISTIQGLSAGGQMVAVDGGYTFNPNNNTSNFNLDQGELQYIVDMNRAGGRDKISLRNGTVGGPSLPVREDTLSLLPEGQEVGLYRNGKPATFTYDVSGKRVDVVDANGKPVTVAFARGFIPSTGESFFKGSDFVEGLGYPDGRDTVPAMVNKGERIVPTVLNNILGGKKLSNEQLVDKVLAHDKLMQMFPDAVGLLTGSQGGSIMKLPEHIMKGAATDMSGVRKDLRDVKQAIENYKPLHLSFDEHGYTKSVIGRVSKTTLIQSLLTR
ncbi:tape measure protein [Spirosoma oryzicola]|uniref:tape measure protein n=1 Tax=Spirosoma oryzicola TaxID=2898794 RepID=UPI001E473C92|nr:tape measure protein [Spirosoma oryzicola]UHG93270.1 tape measure protein [Spirosoma oryzicola]